MILTEQKEHILTITLNRAEKSNAFTEEMIEQFVAELKKADRDPHIRVIVITGAGKNFCAGGDIDKMLNKEGMFAGEPNQLRQLYEEGIQQIPLQFHKMKTPSIAMINGAAVGAGLDLTCMCDIRVASPKARFAESFVKIGLIAGDGGSFFLQRVVGFAKAMELSLTGDLIDAAEALRIGLINYCGEDYKEYSYKLADKIAKNPPIATQMMKRAIEFGHKSELFSHLNLLSSFQGITQRTVDHFEALKGFKQKTDKKYQHK